MLLERRRLTVPPGDRLLLHDVSWDEFEQILEELGDRRTSRIAYHQGVLELMFPLSTDIGTGDRMPSSLPRKATDFVPGHCN